jgi:hypothetical protein
LVSKTQRGLLLTEDLAQPLLRQTPFLRRFGYLPHNLFERGRRARDLTQAQAEKQIYLLAILLRSRRVSFRGVGVNPYGDLSRLHNLSRIYYL